MGNIRAARIQRSNRLLKVLHFLQTRGAQGASTREIIEKCDVCAVNSIIAEIRANGYPISCSTKLSATGSRIATYVLQEQVVVG